MSISGNNHKPLTHGRVRGILLDLDDTLYAYEPCHRARQAAAFGYLAKKLKKNEREIAKIFIAARTAVKQQVPETGASHSRLLYFQRCIEIATGRTDIRMALETERISWKAYFSKMKLRLGAKAFLAAAKKRGVKIAVVSDLTTEIQMKKLIRLGIAHSIDVLVTSEESGRDKPAPDSFRLALKKMKLRPRDVVMIGDDARRDRVGAHRMGIRFSTIHALLKS